MATTRSNTTRFCVVFFHIKFKQKMQVYPYSSSQDTHLLLAFISSSFCSTFALPFHHYLMSPCNAWIQTNPFFLVFAFSFSSCRFWSNDKVPPNHCESDVVGRAWTTARGLAVIVSSSTVLLNSALSDPFQVFDQPNSAAKSTISTLWNWVKVLQLGLKLSTSTITRNRRKYQKRKPIQKAKQASLSNTIYTNSYAPAISLYWWGKTVTPNSSGCAGAKNV